MKESDAKKLRCCGPCPENTGNPDLGNIKAGEEYDDIYYCSGSACAAWDWDEAFTVDEKGTMTGCTNFDTEGHCGLCR